MLYPQLGIIIDLCQGVFIRYEGCIKPVDKLFKVAGSTRHETENRKTGRPTSENSHLLSFSPRSFLSVENFLYLATSCLESI